MGVLHEIFQTKTQRLINPELSHSIKGVDF